MRTRLASVGVSIALAACSSSDWQDGTPSDPDQRPATITQSLNALGVDTRATPRLDGEGVPYDESHSPLGTRFAMSVAADGEVRMGRIFEFLLAGFRLDNGSDDHLSIIDDLDIPADTNIVTPSLIGSDDPVWARDVLGQNMLAASGRDAVAADVNRDGRHEAVVVFEDAGTVSIRLTFVEAAGTRDMEFPLAVPAAAFPVGDLRIAAGDFDMDGGDELAVAISRVPVDGVATGIHVLIIEDEPGDFAVARHIELASAGLGRTVSPVIATGNFDHDGRAELALIVNELRGSNTTADAQTRLLVFDDASTGFTPLLDSPVEALIEDQAVRAVVANLSIADLDGDQVEEIVLAGLTAIVQTCSPGDPSSFVEHVLLVLDDGHHSFEQTAASRSVVTPPSNCPFNDPWIQRHVFVNALDMDGDDDHEIQVNQFVFDEVPAPGLAWDNIPEALRMNDSVMIPAGDGDGAAFDRGTAVMTVADVNADGMDDIVSYRQGNAEIEVYGLNELHEMTRLARIPVVPDNLPGASNPVMLALDVDGDSEIYQYQNDYQLVFTEPTVLAVLASPPCGENIGQIVDDCTTTWGRFQSTGLENERELEFSAGIGVGFKVQGGALTQTDAKSKITISAALGFIRSEAYELTRGYSFTTGALEDAVVFFSIPMDKYTYRVISHPDPGRIGTEVIMGLPRTPVIRMASLNYYNSRIPEDATPLEGVFTHTPGNIGSYKTTAQKDQVLNEMRSLLDQVRITSANDFSVSNGIQRLPAFQPVTSLRGLESEMLGVGQGSGSTEVSLEVSSENSLGRALAFGAEFESQTTIAGIVFDYKLGFEATWTSTMTTGEGTSFVGTVGSIDAGNFEREQYNFGLFTYLRPDPGSYREYQVVDYFVEKR